MIEVIECNRKQLRKALPPMNVAFLPIVTEVRFEQSRKASLSIETTPLILIVVRLLQP